MVFGGHPIPCTGGLGCSTSVCNQMFSIHQLRAISWKAMCLRSMKIVTSYDIHGSERVKREHGDRCKKWF